MFCYLRGQWPNIKVELCQWVILARFERGGGGIVLTHTFMGMKIENAWVQEG